MRKLSQIFPKQRRWLTLEEISKGLNLSTPSTWKLLNRKTKSGEILRAKRNLYLLPETFGRFDKTDFFQLANLLQTPSYISYLTALAHYEMTTQVPQSIIESTNPVRSRSFEIQGIIFRYYFCSTSYYFGFLRKDGFFIAEPEKALIDSLYLLSLGRYALDESALELVSMDWKKIEKIVQKYPPRFKKFFKCWRNKYERS